MTMVFFTGGWDDAKKWLLRAAVADPVAIEIFCHDAAELNALLTKFPTGDDVPDDILRDPEIKALTYRFAEHLVRLRKQHFGPLIANEEMKVTAEEMQPKFDPNPDGSEGYLVNEFGAYLILAQGLTAVCRDFKGWVANDLLTTAGKCK
jgi:hypothetical protein